MLAPTTSGPFPETHLRATTSDRFAFPATRDPPHTESVDLVRSRTTSERSLVLAPLCRCSYSGAPVILWYMPLDPQNHMPRTSSTSQGFSASPPPCYDGPDERENDIREFFSLRVVPQVYFLSHIYRFHQSCSFTSSLSCRATSVVALSLSPAARLSLPPPKCRPASTGAYVYP